MGEVRAVFLNPFANFGVVGCTGGSISDLLGAVSVTDYLLALSTMGDATKNRNDPISVVPPKVAKASI